MNEPYLIEGAVPQSLANLIRESKGESATTKYLPAQFYSELRTIINSGRYLIMRASGAIASFNDAVAAPLVGLRVALPWKAAGWESVTVARRGQNLFDINGNVSFVYDGTAVQDGKIVISSIGRGFTSRVYFSQEYPAGIFTISCKSSGQIIEKRAFSFKPFPGSTYNAYYGGYFADIQNGSLVITMEEPFTLGFIVNGPTRGQGELYDIQVELGSTATAYEPYNGDTYTITLPTTIYGGYLDAVMGQLIATHDANGNLLVNQKLYFLPPININALAGGNNVWSDAGDVTVSYRVEQ